MIFSKSDNNIFRNGPEVRESETLCTLFHEYCVTVFGSPF